MSILAVLFSLVALFPAVDPVARTGACEGTEGVTVAVGVLVRCVPGSPGDARTALERSGLAVRLGDGSGPYADSRYVCRVEGLPDGDPCTGHRDGTSFWKVWRVGLDPVAWRESGTQDGPGAVRVCPGGLVGFVFGSKTAQMPVAPERVVTTPGWLPPRC
ncbi:Conserved putative secreted protein [Amycolatopsis japonica]|uniref:Conserved putative secreted protein n=1 Tax=Amycolatopsis japonica TaxID=208439 RepID=A0A075UZX8_9PSEU|nr:hypothetical protein [Amycolatopsis japonica]AIG75835.1 Conserved putative secreted protein [Amycolatopsis japonica]